MGDRAVAVIHFGSYATVAAALLLAVACDPSARLIGDPEAPGDSDSDSGADSDPTTDTTCDALELGASSVPTNPTCAVAADVSYSPVLRATNEAIGDAYSTPIVGFLDGDDVPEIVVATLNGQLQVLTSDLVVLWSASAMGSEPATPAIGDVDGDGDNDVVAAGASGVAAYDGATGDPLWSIATIPGAAKLPICGGVGLYDFDGDGAMEVVIGRTVLDGKNGALVGAGTQGEGTGHPWAATFGAAADIDGDGTLEVVVGNAAYHADGTSLWENGLVDGFVAVANFDADVGLETVVSTYGDQGSGGPGTLRLQDDNGGATWSVALASNSAGPPAVADFDGDGKPEIVVVGNNMVQRFDGDGRLVWRRTVADFSSGFTGVSAFDFDGDGVFEVVYADENDLWVFDGLAGTVLLQETRHSSATCSEYPTIVDLDGDGHAEIVYTSSTYSSPETGVRVLADPTWGPAPRTWTQHALASPAGWRAAAAPPLGSDARVLVDDPCCTDATVSVVVRVGNTGVDALPAGKEVSVYAMAGEVATLIGSATTPSAVLPGETTSGMRFDLARSVVGAGAIRVVVDGSGVLPECDEGDDVVVVNDLCGGM